MNALTLGARTPIPFQQNLGPSSASPSGATLASRYLTRHAGHATIKSVVSRRPCARRCILMETSACRRPARLGRVYDPRRIDPEGQGLRELSRDENGAEVRSTR
jgi:hypothetical protein